jgi:predicted nuclease of restriction endonuclease-like (RecB) superfamily
MLTRQIENQAYEQYLLNQTNFKQTLPDASTASLTVKDEYTFDFLDLADDYTESQLETELVHNIRNFLLEMGPQFTFIGNQYRLAVDDHEYFIDLLLYHRQRNALSPLS